MASTYSSSFTFKLSKLEASMTETPDTAVLAAVVRKFASLADKLTVTLTSETANNAAGGGDLVYGTILSIAGGGTTTLDLTSVTDLAQRATQSFGRVKFIALALLSTAQGGSAATKVTVGKAASNANTLFLSGNTDGIEIKNGQFLLFGDAGAAGQTVDSTHKNVLITNDDGSVAAKLAILLVGGDS